MWVILGIISAIVFVFVILPLYRQWRERRRLGRLEGTGGALAGISVKDRKFKRKSRNKTLRGFRTKFKILCTFYQISGQVRSER